MDDVPLMNDPSEFTPLQIVLPDPAADLAADPDPAHTGRAARKLAADLSAMAARLLRDPSRLAEAQWLFGRAAYLRAVAAYLPGGASSWVKELAAEMARGGPDLGDDREEG